MKMLSRYKFYTINFLAAIFILSLPSCGEDDKYDVTGSTENTVFINTRNWSPVGVNNGIVFNLKKTPVGSFIINAEKIEAKFTVHCTQPASQDIVVKLEKDNSLIANGYSAFPSGVSLNMDKTQLTIPKGAMMANDSVTISVSSDQLGLFNPEECMYPIKIVEVNNAELSNDYRSVALLVNTIYTNCLNDASSITGVAANRTGWTATANDVDQGTKLFDNARNTNFRTTSFSAILEFDLGAVHQDITGFAIENYSANYGMGLANIYSSETGTDNYVSQGSATFLRGTVQYLNFYKKINARYIKIEVISPYSASYGLYVTEFNVYQ